MKNKKLIKYIKIPKICDDCFLIFAESQKHIPFKIKRVYYILQSKPGLPRGLHAHFKTKQVLFCIQGSATIILDNGRKKTKITLDKPNIGVLLNPLIWHEMHRLKKETILLILASKEYDPEDYIRDYSDFKRIINKNESNQF